MTDDAARDLRETLEQMANVCSVNMELWDKHSNAVLTAAARIEALVAEKDMAWKTQVDMSERYIAASREVRKFSELADANRRRAEAAEAERERDEAREAAHYANGTAELAMKHRDTAEARVKELEDRLRCGEGSDRERQLLRKLEKLVTRVRALEAALLKVTCDQAATPADWHEARAALKGE